MQPSPAPLPGSEGGNQHRAGKKTCEPPTAVLPYLPQRPRSPPVSTSSAVETACEPALGAGGGVQGGHAGPAPGHKPRAQAPPAAATSPPTRQVCSAIAPVSGGGRRCGRACGRPGHEWNAAGRQRRAVPSAGRTSAPEQEGPGGPRVPSRPLRAGEVAEQ